CHLVERRRLERLQVQGERLQGVAAGIRPRQSHLQGGRRPDTALLRRHRRHSRSRDGLKAVLLSIWRYRKKEQYETHQTEGRPRTRTVPGDEYGHADRDTDRNHGGNVYTEPDTDGDHGHRMP